VKRYIRKERRNAIRNSRHKCNSRKFVAFQAPEKCHEGKEGSKLGIYSLWHILLNVRMNPCRYKLILLRKEIFYYFLEQATFKK
jgi:hypothetical protein